MARSWWVDYCRRKVENLDPKKGKLKKTLLHLSIGKIPKKDKPKSLCMYISIYSIMVQGLGRYVFSKKTLASKKSSQV